MPVTTMEICNARRGVFTKARNGHTAAKPRLATEEWRVNSGWAKYLEIKLKNAPNVYSVNAEIAQLLNGKFPHTWDREELSENEKTIFDKPCKHM